MNVTPRFSFNYNGKPFDLPGVKVLKEAFGYSYCTEDGLVVELHIEEYPEYGTAGWTLWFENKGVSDSGLISDIRDCDTLWCFAEKGPVTLYETTGNTSYESYLHDDTCAAEFSVR